MHLACFDTSVLHSAECIKKGHRRNVLCGKTDHNLTADLESDVLLGILLVMLASQQGSVFMALG